MCLDWKVSRQTVITSTIKVKVDYSDLHVSSIDLNRNFDCLSPEVESE